MGYFHVAVDGPVGAGKSTVARLAAEEAGFLYVDTGAMYRAVAVYAISRGADLSDEAAVCALLDDINISLALADNADGTQRVLLNGCDISGDIRTDQVSMGASAVGQYRFVRQKLVEQQQRIACTANVIMDGRDIGTHVLPGANLKIYLDAAVCVRARRRWLELVNKGFSADYDSVLRDVTKRDFDDKNRAESPLRVARGAVVIDAGDISAEEAADMIISLIKERGGLVRCCMVLQRHCL